MELATASAAVLEMELRNTHKHACPHTLYKVHCTTHWSGTLHSQQALAVVSASSEA